MRCHVRAEQRPRRYGEQRHPDHSHVCSSTSTIAVCDGSAHQNTSQQACPCTHQSTQTSLPPDTSLEAPYIHEEELHYQIFGCSNSKPIVLKHHQRASCTLSRMRSDAEQVPCTKFQGDLDLRTRGRGERKKDEQSRDQAERLH